MVKDADNIYYCTKNQVGGLCVGGVSIQPGHLPRSHFFYNFFLQFVLQFFYNFFYNFFFTFFLQFLIEFVVKYGFWLIFLENAVFVDYRHVFKGTFF